MALWRGKLARILQGNLCLELCARPIARYKSNEINSLARMKTPTPTTGAPGQNMGKYG